MAKIHLDTDIGGDIDDLCALALLLRWPGVEVTGITTVAEDSGRRAGYARYVLRLAGRADIPVAAGADVSLGCFRCRPGYPPEDRYWPESVAPLPGSVDAALGLLRQSIEQDATVVGIGPFTNLSLLEDRHPGILAGIRLVLMGGHVRSAPAGFPQWDTMHSDYNVQLDAGSAQRVLMTARPTLVPVEVTLQTALRRAYLPALRRAGPLGALLARQAEAFARDSRYEQLYGRTCAGLPDDTINFQHDPLACAVALGWDGVHSEHVPLAVECRDALLHTRIAPTGRPTPVVSAVEGAAFNELWLRTVTAS